MVLMRIGYTAKGGRTSYLRMVLAKKLLLMAGFLGAAAACGSVSCGVGWVNDAWA